MIFKGTATALITPFIGNGVDYDSLKKLIDFQIENGVNALVVLGTTGEPATMSHEEKEHVIQTAIAHTNKRVPVIVGAGSNSTKTAIEMCQNAQRLGADALLVVTPYYNKCTQEGLVEHYNAIANATTLPVLCYNVQSRTGVNMLPSTFEKIARNKNIVGIKEASGNMEQIEKYIALCKDMEKEVYSGDDALTVPIMAMGGAGVISVASNAFPKYVSAMTEYALDSNIKKASEMQLKMLPLISALFCEVNPIPIKTAMGILGKCDGALRLPLTKMSDEHKKMLEKVLDDFAKLTL